MARIPVYEQKTTPSAGFSVSQASSVDLNLEAQGRVLQGLGQAVGDAANAAVAIEEADAQSRVRATVAKAREEMDNAYINQTMQMQPGDRDFAPRFMTETFDSWSNKELEQIPSGRYRKLLGDKMLDLREEYRRKAVSFQAEQNMLGRIQTQKDAMSSDAKYLYNNPTGENLYKIREETYAAIDNDFMPPDQKAKLREEARVLYGRTGAEAMAQNQPAVLLAQVADAKRRIKEGKNVKSSGNPFLDMLDPTEWDTYIEMAEKQNDFSSAESVSASVWARLGPKSDNEPTNLDQLNKAIDEEMAGFSPESRKTAKALLEEAAKDRDYAVKQRVAFNEAGVWQQQLDGKSLNEIKNSPEFQALDGTKKFELLSQLSSDTNSSQSLEQLANQLELSSDPAALAAMTNEQIIAMAPLVHTTGVKNLLKEQAKLNSPEAIKEATLDAKVFKMVADRAGLKPYETDKNEVRLRKLGQFEDAIKTRIAIEEGIKKRKLTPDEKRKIAEEEADNVVMVEDAGWFWFDKQVPVALLTPEQQEDAYVIVNGQQVRVSIVPKPYRDQIISSRLKKGLTVTEEDIVSSYLIIKEREKEENNQ